MTSNLQNAFPQDEVIYVIDDENALILRFLFTFNSENSNFNNIVFNIIKKKMETNQAYSEYSTKKKEELESNWAKEPNDYFI